MRIFALALLASLTAACTSAASDGEICEAAIEHVVSCIPEAQTTSGSACDAAAAEQVLDQSCEELAANKADLLTDLCSLFFEDCGEQPEPDRCQGEDRRNHGPSTFNRSQARRLTHCAFGNDIEILDARFIEDDEDASAVVGIDVTFVDSGRALHAFFNLFGRLVAVGGPSDNPL